MLRCVTAMRWSATRGAGTRPEHPGATVEQPCHPGEPGSGRSTFRATQNREAEPGTSQKTRWAVPRSRSPS